MSDDKIKVKVRLKAPDPVLPRWRPAAPNSVTKTDTFQRRWDALKLAASQLGFVVQGQKMKVSFAESNVDVDPHYVAPSQESAEIILFLKTNL